MTTTFPIPASIGRTNARAASSAKRARVPSVAVALCAVSAAMALTLWAGMPWNSVAAAAHPPAVVSNGAVTATLPIADPVDWSLIEVSPDPGPMAVAAYGP